MIRRRRMIAAIVTVSATLTAAAQDTRDPDNPTELIPGPPTPVDIDALLASLAPVRTAQLGGSIAGGGGPGFTNTIVITGYWPPTNNMIRRFSNNATQNPLGWIGQNYNCSGFNVYAFFPEFAGPGPNWGKGTGDFEVDYQDTSADWWSIIPALRPVGIITFSRADPDLDWEIEGGNRNVAAAQWSADYLAPLRPTSEAPSYNETPLPNTRFTTQPAQAIINAVEAQLPTLNCYATALDTGLFLSNYIGYHGNWYHDLHSALDDPSWNVVAGHIHVGYSMSAAQAEQAATITVGVVVDHVKAAVDARLKGDVNCDFSIDFFDIDPFLLALFDPTVYQTMFPCCNILRADVSNNGIVDFFDIDPFLDVLF